MKPVEGSLGLATLSIGSESTIHVDLPCRPCESMCQAARSVTEKGAPGPLGESE